MRLSFGVLLVTVILAATIAGQDEKGYVQVDGTKLFYQKVGSGSQTVVVPLHLYMYDDFRHMAGKQTYIFYDVRNRGRSDAATDMTKVTIQQDVEDLEVLRKHFKIDKMSLIGESYVGLMVVMYAIKYPQHVERLVQIGPVPLKFGTEYPKEFTFNDPSPVPPTADAAKLDQLRQQGYHLTNPQDFCYQDWTINRARLVGNPANVDKVRPVCHLSNEWPANLYKHFGAHFVSVQRLDIPPSGTASVTVPVLTIHGTRDRNVAYGAGREWAKLLPNARLLTVKDAAHMPWLDEPQVVFGAIREFLNGRYPARAEKIQ